MQIKLAKYSGFCFGVKRAVEKVYSLIDMGFSEENPRTPSIYTLGKLIHNPHIISDLEKKGVRAIDEDEIDEIYKNATEENPCILVIRTHGVTKEVNDKINNFAQENKNFKVIDCTCPFVKNIHEIAKRRTEKDDVFLVIGDKNHPEVKGISSYANGKVIIAKDLTELDLCKLDNKKVIMTAQTTQNLTEWEKCQEYLKKHCTNYQIFDTICNVTENRQKEIEKLSAEVDLMIVVGGKESSNTNKLYSIAKTKCKNALLVENASELIEKMNSLDGTINSVGIAAGASTPDSIIEEVQKTMSEKFETGENFAELLEESFKKTLNTGDIVKGVITTVSPNELHVDISSKVTGIIPHDQITNDPSFKLEQEFKVGDEIEAKIVRISDIDGTATLSLKSLISKQNKAKLVSAYNAGETLSGKVVDVVKGGVVVSVFSNNVFVPASQTGLGKEESLDSLKGQMVKIKIIELDEEKNRTIGSIRAVQREERKAKIEEFWNNIEVGKKYVGKVKSLTSYGAFVDIGGVDGMIHSSELSWSKIKAPSDVVSVNDTVEVYVIDFDREKKRISLGYKTEETNPWHIFTNTYKVGDVVDAKIVSIMPFGAFAEIIPGIDGLIHISQIANKKIANPANEVSIGQVVKVKILEIDNEKQKISLSMRALLEEEVVTTTEE